MTTKHRLYEIDLFRFFAAIAVVFYHYGFRGWMADDLSRLAAPGLAPVVQYGYLGVDLFFIISGFVILLTAGRGDTYRFVVSRAVRLYPAFWFCVSLTAFWLVFLDGGALATVSLPQYIANLTMISGFLYVPHVDGVYWSLLVEIKFYFLVFILLLLGMMPRIQLFLGAWLALTLANLSFNLPPAAVFFLFPEWSPYFIAGALFYLVYRDGMTPVRGLMLSVSWLLAVIQGMTRSLDLAAYFDYAFEPLIVAGIITACFGVFLLLSLGKTRSWAQPGFIHLGVMTYPLYLIHQNIGYVLLNRFAGTAHPVVLICTVAAAMMVVAFAIHHLWEKPLALWMKQLFTRGGEWLSRLPADGFAGAYRPGSRKTGEAVQ